MRCNGGTLRCCRVSEDEPVSTGVYLLPNVQIELDLSYNGDGAVHILLAV